MLYIMTTLMLMEENEVSIVDAILGEIALVLENVEGDSIDKFAEGLSTAERIFVVGEGRSGLMGKSFAMRLMHLGAQIFVVGETITPAIASNDLLVAISGSGKTESVLNIAKRAKRLGCNLFSVTSNMDAELARVSTYAFSISAATKFRKSDEAITVQPLGSLFDQCAHIILDAVCLRYAQLKQQSNEVALKRHTNLE